MLRLISHRGNLNGPNPDRENTLSYLKEALAAGYDVECDVWCGDLVDGKVVTPGLKFWLGHDEPREEVPLSFLRDNRVWVHCKDEDAYEYLKKFLDINCFISHDSISSSVTSRGYHWLHTDFSGVLVSDNNISPYGALKGSYTDINLSNAIKNGNVCGLYSNSFSKIKPEVQRPFELLVIDIDGVMSDGKVYGLDGKVIGKSFCDLDFTAIKRFKAAGIQVCFLSGDRTINEAMAATRKVDFHHNVAGVDKVERLPDLEKAYNVNRSRICYVGDDIYDVGIMSHVGTSYCPASSPSLVRKAASSVLDVLPGKGVIATLFDHLENRIPQVYPVDSPDMNPS